MKNLKSIIGSGLLSLLGYLPAHTQITGDTTIAPQKLEITCAKTTNLIFPFTIKSVDRGSEDVLVQRAKGVENVLQVKAARPNFSETNLTVITSDGRLYSYAIAYTDSPIVLNIKYGTIPSLAYDADLSGELANEGFTKFNAALAANLNTSVVRIKDRSHQVVFELKGLYIEKDLLYAVIGFSNQSNIDYNIEQLRFYIRDQRKAKRTATQELEIKPTYVYNETSLVKANQNKLMAFALPKFTIPDKKYFMIQVLEKNGGRHFELRIKNRAIMKATPIL